MDTIHQQHKLACEEALRLYESIEAAVEGNRTGSAKGDLQNLRALLKNRSGVFVEAEARLPQQVTPKWRDEAAFSKSKIETYLYQLLDEG